MADVSGYRFTDQELDSESGLYNYDARLYDPVIGRFVSADPTVPYLYKPQSHNRYSYCRNNPLNFLDPTGLWDEIFHKSWGARYYDLDEQKSPLNPLYTYLHFMSKDKAKGTVRKRSESRRRTKILLCCAFLYGLILPGTFFHT